MTRLLEATGWRVDERGLGIDDHLLDRDRLVELVGDELVTDLGFAHRRDSHRAALGRAVVGPRASTMGRRPSRPVPHDGAGGLRLCCEFAGAVSRAGPAGAGDRPCRAACPGGPARSARSASPRPAPAGPSTTQRYAAERMSMRRMASSAATRRPSSRTIAATCWMEAPRPHRLLLGAHDERRLHRDLDDASERGDYFGKGPLPPLARTWAALTSEERRADRERPTARRGTTRTGTSRALRMGPSRRMGVGAPGSRMLGFAHGDVNY